MRNYFIAIWQFVSYCMLAIPFRLILNIKRNKTVFLKSKGCILVANHPSRIDPFIATYSLPLRQFLSVLPIRFVTAEKYMKIFPLKLVMASFGAFSTQNKGGKKVLQVANELLKRGETVFIFPRGFLEINDNKSNLTKVGAVYLQREIPSAPIIPIRITISNCITLSNLVRRKIKTYVNYKSSVKYSNFSEDLQPLADDLMRKVYSK